MSKELVIIFLYDFELIKNEADDPEDAIVYFYPSWVNGEQRLALCSQLMGVTQFFKHAFSDPNIISLQSGKFALRRIGHYTLCVGTDRNIPDMVLKTRSDILYKLIQLFHYDIEALHASLSEDDDSLTDRFSQLLQVYLPILQYATNTLGNLTTLKIPKSASTLFLEAHQTLQSFQGVEGVLGGTMLYQNKVVASQLNYSLTKLLVVTDPYRIKLPVQYVTTPFHLPMGVQLLVVYVNSSEVKRLRDDVDDLRRGLREVENWRAENASTSSHRPARGMRRDMSRVFSALVEESVEAEIEAMPEVVRKAVRTRQMARMQPIVLENFIITNPAAGKQSQTTDDILSTINIPIRYYSLGLPSMKAEWCSIPDREKKDKIRPYYNTISDPKYPLFRRDGLPASFTLFNSRIDSNFECLKNDIEAEKAVPRPRSISIKSDSEVSKVPQKAKRQFSLPLNTNSGSSSMSNPHSIALTPLMAKLTLLAHEEPNLDTPVFSRPKPLKTPGTAKTPFEPSTSFSQAYQEERKKESASTSANEMKNGNEAYQADLENIETIENILDPNEEKVKTDETTSDDLVPLVLYVFGLSNSSILLLLENSASTDPECIHSLWEKSVQSLKHIEERLHQCVDHLPVVDCSDYSYAVADTKWGPTERGGAYQPHQLELLTTLHFTLNSNPTFTDILVRGEDTVSYGYQCGQKQYFYQENCVANSGVPTPADIMGIIPIKAKRVLERDHNIVLL